MAAALFAQRSQSTTAEIKWLVVAG